MHNAEIARKFHELADLLEIQNANPFRVRAYRNAASVVEGARINDQPEEKPGQICFSRFPAPVFEISQSPNKCFTEPQYSRPRIEVG